MFTGYTDQTVDVFWGIRFNNDRAWFAEHKQEFQDAVMTPTKALAGELYDWFQETYPDLHLNVHISRIYRDARRLFGRGPLNDHIWFSFQNAIENRGEAPCGRLYNMRSFSIESMHPFDERSSGRADRLGQSRLSIPSPILPAL